MQAQSHSSRGPMRQEPLCRVAIRARRGSLAARSLRPSVRRATARLSCEHGLRDRSRAQRRARRRAAPPPRRSRSQSRRVEADLVAHIGEVDERRLYASQAFPSMFAYCTERLHLSEAEAYRRITVARAARRHGALLATLREGRLHLSGIAQLAPFLSEDNREALLERASHLSKRQLEQLVARAGPAAGRAFRDTEATAAASRVGERRYGSGPGRRFGDRTRPGTSRGAGTGRTQYTAPRRAAFATAARWPPDDLRQTSAITARTRRAVVAGPLQGAVHGERRAARQDRAVRPP